MRSAQEHRPAPHRPAGRLGGYHLPIAYRLPVESPTHKEFPDDSSVQRTFQRWIELGVLDRIWAALVEECEELGGIDWEWQAADGAMGKARFGGT
jgi:hypothetical protein